MSTNDQLEKIASDTNIEDKVKNSMKISEDRELLLSL